MTTITTRVQSLLAMLLWVAAAGCGPASSMEAVKLEAQSAKLESLNGLSANGLSANGLSANGLSANGLSANGLSANGLSTSVFATWFSNEPALGDMVMRYVVRCAVPAGETRSYTDAITGQRYTWNGGLGLAPGWASGAPANLAEQQVITACLLAHVNRYGLSIPISVLGRDALATVIPYTHDELETYSVREACFFGNLFNQEGLFFGVDQHVTDEAQYLTRACAGMEDAGGNPNTRCEPLVYVGGCKQSCWAEPKSPFYSVCARNGVIYRPITTRMRQSDYDELFAGLTASEPESVKPRDDPRGEDHTGKKK